MDRSLEHLLLVIALLEELGRNRARLRVALQVAALLLDQELFLWRYLDRHPFSEVHLSGADCPMVPTLTMKRKPLPTDLAPVWARCVDRLKISATGCWEWQGCKTIGGYGRVWFQKPRLVHVVSYFHHCGPVADDLVISHKCHNPACCNPVHLQPASQKENVRQSIDRGTFFHTPRALKLTQEQRAQIRREYKGTRKHRQELAEQYKVSVSLIEVVVYRKREVAS